MLAYFTCNLFMPGLYYLNPQNTQDCVCDSIDQALSLHALIDSTMWTPYERGVDILRGRLVLLLDPLGLRVAARLHNHSGSLHKTMAPEEKGVHA